VNRTFLGKDALQDFGQQIRIEGKTTPNNASQLILVLNHDQGPDPTLGQPESGLSNQVVRNPARLLGSSQKKPNRVGVNQDLPDLGPEDHNDHQDGNRPEPPEEPAGENQTRSVRHLLKEPEGNQTDRDLEGNGATHEKEEPMQYETDYEDI